MEYSIPETAQHIIGDLNQDGYEIYKDGDTAIIQDNNEVWEEDWSDDFYRGLLYDEYKGWVIDWEEKNNDKEIIEINKIIEGYDNKPQVNLVFNGNKKELYLNGGSWYARQK